MARTTSGNKNIKVRPQVKTKNRFHALSTLPAGGGMRGSWDWGFVNVHVHCALLEFEPHLISIGPSLYVVLLWEI
jgi:hypothetical protein